MTSKEIIQRVIKLETTPRLPVSLLSAGAWTLNQSGLTLEQALAVGPQRIAESIAKTNEIVGCDIVWPGSGYHNLAIRGIGGRIKFRVKGTPDVQEPILRDNWAAEQISTKRVQEDRGIRVLVEAAPPVQIHRRQDGGRHQSVAPFTLGGMAFGVENLMRGVRKDKAAVHAVVGFAADLCYDYLEPFIDAGVSMISLADPTASGDMISREQFIEFSFPYLKRVADRIRARGVWVIVHICGNTTNRLDRIPETGAQIMSVDYKVALSDAHRILDGKIAFAGNLNPETIMQKETAEGVAAASRDAIGKALSQSGAAAGYILMPGCDIPPSVPIENVKTMVQTAHAYPL